MINGITWHGMHSQLDFGATLIERDTNFPEKERITERVPYSSVTYDFTELYGKASYPERELKYKFVISDERGIHYLKKRVDKFKKWLYNPISKSELYEDKETEYHFKAVCTQITENYTHPVKCEITVTFKADPYRMPSVPPERTAIPISDCRYPDIDGDGRSHRRRCFYDTGSGGEYRCRASVRTDTGTGTACRYESGRYHRRNRCSFCAAVCRTVWCRYLDG